MNLSRQTEEEAGCQEKETDFHARWVWLSRLIVSGGVILGALANHFLGREFKSSDPLIGSLLIPLSVVWFLAFFHLMYTSLRGQLSAPVRWLCYFTITIFAIILLSVVFSW